MSKLITEMDGILLACPKCGSLTFVAGSFKPLPYSITCPRCGYSSKVHETRKIWNRSMYKAQIKMQHLTILVSNQKVINRIQEVMQQ